MAKIHLKGNLSYDVTNEQAEHAQKMWKMPGIRLITLNNGTISFKSSEIKAISLDTPQSKGFKYNLANEHDRYLIMDFDRELGDRSFEQYALDKGYIFKKAGYNDYFVNRDTIQEYNDARDRFKALEAYREHEYREQKRLHSMELAEQGKTVCQEKSIKTDRCVYCWPWTFAEYFEAHGRPDIAQRIHNLK